MDTGPYVYGTTAVGGQMKRKPSGVYTMLCGLITHRTPRPQPQITPSYCRRLHQDSNPLIQLPLMPMVRFR